MSEGVYRVFKYMGQGYWTLYRNRFLTLKEAQEFVTRTSRNKKQRYKIVTDEVITKEVV